MIRQARESDVPAMVQLSELKRIEYESYSPIFWRKAADSAEKQEPFLLAQLGRVNNLCLVSEAVNGVVHGFIIASIVTAPVIDEYFTGHESDLSMLGCSLDRAKIFEPPRVAEMTPRMW